MRSSPFWNMNSRKFGAPSSLTRSCSRSGLDHGIVRTRSMNRYQCILLVAAPQAQNVRALETSPRPLRLQCRSTAPALRPGRGEWRPRHLDFRQRQHQRHLSRAALPPRRARQACPSNTLSPQRIAHLHALTETVLAPLDSLSLRFRLFVGSQPRGTIHLRCSGRRAKSVLLLRRAGPRKRLPTEQTPQRSVNVIVVVIPGSP